MRRKLPSDAFTYYVSLGPDRTYGTVAKYFQVDKRTVLRHASAQKWQAQIAEICNRAARAQAPFHDNTGSRRSRMRVRVRCARMTASMSL